MATDSHRIGRDPDPTSRAAYVRISSYSSSADFVLTVIVDAQDLVRRDRMEDERR